MERSITVTIKFYHEDERIGQKEMEEFVRSKFEDQEEVGGVDYTLTVETES